MQDRWQYREIMKDAAAKKMADKNPNPVFDGIQEPPLPFEDEIFNDPIGPDRNKNGIRDDIDIWINRSIKEYNLRMGYRQFALANQEMVSAAYRGEYSNSNLLASNVLKALACNEFLITVYKIDVSKDRYNEGVQNLSVMPKTRIQNFEKFSNSITHTNPDGITNKEYKQCQFEIKNQDLLVSEYQDLIKKMKESR
jgi:hypothetical protein